MGTKWQYALCQHPMWLIIDQDTVCAERTPPWGAPNLEVYVERLHRNLDAMKRFPDLELNFDTSGVELEDIAERYPDIINKMKDLIHRGKLTFLNGTYSQPHLQNFGLESTIRQFQYGLEVYKKLFSFHVDTYAAQEVGITEQLPQILHNLNYRFVVVPHFSWAITFLTPHEVVGYEDHLEPVHGCEFTSWQGLDNTEIPLYITQVLFHKGITNKGLELETVRDLYQGPPIKAFTPDLIEVDEEMIIEQLKNGVFIRLDKALEKRIKVKPPVSKARFYTYWSYVEGIRAEELSRANMKAEEKLIQAEIIDACFFNFSQKKKIDFDNLWKKILKCQHHDAYWAGAPELRDKSIRWLKEVSDTAEEYINNNLRGLSKQIKTDYIRHVYPMIVYSTYGKKQSTVGKFQLPVQNAENVVLLNKEKKEIPSQIVSHQDGVNSVEIIFQYDSPGVGYELFFINTKNGNKPHNSEVFTKALKWENPFYNVKVMPDGTFRSLQLLESGIELLDTKAYHGNEMKGLFCGQKWVSSRGKGKGVIQYGSIADVITIHNQMEDVPVRMQIYLYHSLPWMDMVLDLNFNHTSIGNFWDDESKLNLYWPLSGQNDINHGIGGGTVKVLPERPFFAINWVDMIGPNGSLALLNHGTLKHWTRNNVLAMVIGWGKEGNQFTNRRHANWSKSFDLRLNGKQTIQYSVYPHIGNWEKANIADWAMAKTHPPIVTVTDLHHGKLPPKKTDFTLDKKNLVPTSIRRSGNRNVCRFYESVGQSTNLPKNKLKSIGFKKICDLKGKPLKKINPFQIAEIDFITKK